MCFTVPTTFSRPSKKMVALFVISVDAVLPHYDKLKAENCRLPYSYRLICTSVIDFYPTHVTQLCRLITLHLTGLNL